MNTIQRLDIFTFKCPHHYKIGGHEETPNRLPGTDYYIEPQWKQVYSKLTESCLVKITTSDGTFGWGEAQSPITPETTATLMRTLLGPALLNREAGAIDALNDRLFSLMQVRGHVGSFIVDAIAGLDTALWDIRGKQTNQPISKMLNPSALSLLPAYVSGLRKKTVAERAEVAAQFVREGFAGVKMFTGADLDATVREAHAIRAAVPECFFAVDALWSYRLPDAKRLARELEALDTAWLEAPLDIEDLEGHTVLARDSRVPIAVGEGLRTPSAFAPWMKSRAMAVAQPDVMRTGISGATRIRALAEENDLHTALHVGVCTGIGMAATWHTAAAFAGPLPQEHQGELFLTANRILSTPLQVNDGQLLVPPGPGLGIEVDEDAVRGFSTEHWIVDNDGHRLSQGEGNC